MRKPSEWWMRAYEILKKGKENWDGEERMIAMEAREGLPELIRERDRLVARVYTLEDRIKEIARLAHTAP